RRSSDLPSLGPGTHVLEKRSYDAATTVLRVGHDVLHVDLGGVVLALEGDHRTDDGAVIGDGDGAGGGEQSSVEPVVGQGACADVRLTELHQLLDFTDLFAPEECDDHGCSPGWILRTMLVSCCAMSAGPTASVTCGADTCSESRTRANLDGRCRVCSRLR